MSCSSHVRLFRTMLTLDLCCTIVPAVDAFLSVTNSINNSQAQQLANAIDNSQVQQLSQNLLERLISF
jgi:hypothetical protein